MEPLTALIPLTTARRVRKSVGSGSYRSLNNIPRYCAPSFSHLIKVLCSHLFTLAVWVSMCKLTDKAQHLWLQSHSFYFISVWIPPQPTTLPLLKVLTHSCRWREREGWTATLTWSVKYNRINLVWSGHYFSQGQMHTYPATVKPLVLLRSAVHLNPPRPALFLFLLSWHWHLTI